MFRSLLPMYVRLLRWLVRWIGVNELARGDFGDVQWWTENT